MNLVAKILNNVALTSAKSSENVCPIICLDEPKMPTSMVK